MKERKQQMRKAMKGKRVMIKKLIKKEGTGNSRNLTCRYIDQEWENFPHGL